MSDELRFDWQRGSRVSIPEVVFAQGKTIEHLHAIAQQALELEQSVLMTRVDAVMAHALAERYLSKVCWNETARTVIVGDGSSTLEEQEYDINDSATSGINRRVAVVSAGTSDYALVAEVEQCLQFLGVSVQRFSDVGVAGLWRLTQLTDELNQYPIFIAVAGMEGALFSVLAGLVKGPVIALPSSVGYGVSADGYTALNSALSSCAPGIAVVNIDNGFGAAALAVKILDSVRE